MKLKLFLIITLLFSLIFSSSVFAEDSKLQLQDNKPAQNNAMLKLEGLVKFNELEGGFYEIDGYRLSGSVDFSKYLGRTILVFGKADDSPSIYMTKAIKVKGFRILSDERKNPHFEQIGIFINGSEVLSDVPPVLKNDRVLVPVRVITEKLGAKVEWEEATKTVTISNKYMTIKLVAGSNKALIYHNFDFTGIPEEVILDQTAEIINNRTIVPLRFIFERFNAQVSWVQEGQLVIIESEDALNEAEKDVNENDGKKKEEANNKGSIDSGTYTGRIDSNFIEIRISGVPENIGFRSFQLSEDLKVKFDSLGLQKNDTVKFTYITNEKGAKVIISIEKI